MHYVVKAAVADANGKLFSFRAQKTMYGGKAIRAKDEVFIFSSENEGGEGLIARGIGHRDRVAVLDKNCDSFFEIYFGATKAGAVLPAGRG